MNRIAIYSILCCCGLSGCDEPPPVRAPKPSHANPGPPTTSPEPLNWQDFSHADGKFTVRIPGTPQMQILDNETVFGTIKLYLFVADRPKRYNFSVAYADYPPSPQFQDPERAHDILKDVLKGNVSYHKATASDPRTIDSPGLFGQECEFTKEGGQLWRVRVYLRDNRLYQLAAVRFEGGAKATDSTRFLDSFHVIEPEN